MASHAATHSPDDALAVRTSPELICGVDEQSPSTTNIRNLLVRARSSPSHSEAAIELYKPNFSRSGLEERLRDNFVTALRRL